MPKTQCPICLATEITLFAEISNVPTHCNLLWSTAEAACEAPRGDIQLGFCPTCGHVFNAIFAPALMEYTQRYENSLHFSPRFQSYAIQLAQRLIEKYALYNKTIIDIGCGQGDFLDLLCEKGQNRGIGFDPSYLPNAEFTSRHLSFVQDFYSEKYASYTADFICCRQVLEHIHKPREFLLSVRRAIGSKQGAKIFFEVPNGLFMLRDLSIWDIIYEHYAYFCAGSLANLFQTCGFEVLQVNEEYAGQFISLEARPSSKTAFADQSWPGLTELTQNITSFGANFTQKIQLWQQYLARFAQKQQRVVVWGAGSKGVMFLNALPVQNSIRYVVDINPRKQGMFVAGRGQEIVAPSFLATFHPDVIIIMNAIYEAEIRQTMASFGLEAEFICV